MLIGKLKLPERLVENFGRIRRLSKEEALRLAALTPVKAPWPELYSLAAIERENTLWTSKSVRYYLGGLNHSYIPGNIDPDKAIIIGQADEDCPIVLDYRSDPPRVVYYADAEKGKSYWVEVCASYEELLEKVFK